jgi:hypothetical protein
MLQGRERSWGLQLWDLETGMEEYLLRCRWRRGFHVHSRGAMSEIHTLHASMVFCQRMLTSIKKLKSVPSEDLQANKGINTIKKKPNLRSSVVREKQNEALSMLWVCIWSLPPFTLTICMWVKCFLKPCLLVETNYVSSKRAKDMQELRDSWQ